MDNFIVMVSSGPNQIRIVHDADSTESFHTKSHKIWTHILTSIVQGLGRTGSQLQMNRFNLRNNRWKFKTAGKLPVTLRGIYRIYPNLIKENRRMSTHNRLDLGTLGSQPVMPKNLPDHWYSPLLYLMHYQIHRYLLICRLPYCMPTAIAAKQMTFIHQFHCRVLFRINSRKSHIISILLLQKFSLSSVLEIQIVERLKHTSDTTHSYAFGLSKQVLIATTVHLPNTQKYAQHITNHVAKVYNYISFYAVCSVTQPPFL